MRERLREKYAGPIALVTSLTMLVLVILLLIDGPRTI